MLSGIGVLVNNNCNIHLSYHYRIVECVVPPRLLCMLYSRERCFFADNHAQIKSVREQFDETHHAREAQLEESVAAIKKAAIESQLDDFVAVAIANLDAVQ